MASFFLQARMVGGEVGPQIGGNISRVRVKCQGVEGSESSARVS